MLSRLLLATLVLTLGLGAARATEDVLSVTTSTTPGTSSDAEGYTFENTQQSLTGFTTATNAYEVIASADNVFVRRNDVSNNQSSVWYASSGVGTNLGGIHQDNYGQMLAGNNILAGSDNIFANGTGNSTGNIERVDFTWNSGITVNNSFALAVFDRGAVNVHDGFAIAVVTAVDAMGNPTAYGSLLVVNGGWGASNAIADFTYRLFRYSDGDVTTTSTASTETATQGIGGLVITATDLGLTDGMTIYGYSLMAGDVTATDPSQLLDWNNSTYFPTTTDSTTGSNGLDLLGVNGLLFAVVPEARMSAGLLGAFVALVSLCHQLRKRSRVRQS